MLSFPAELITAVSVVMQRVVQTAGETDAWTHRLPSVRRTIHIGYEHVRILPTVSTQNAFHNGGEERSESEVGTYVRSATLWKDWPMLPSKRNNRHTQHESLLSQILSISDPVIQTSSSLHHSQDPSWRKNNQKTRGIPMFSLKESYQKCKRTREEKVAFFELTLAIHCNPQYLLPTNCFPEVFPIFWGRDEFAFWKWAPCQIPFLKQQSKLPRILHCWLGSDISVVLLRVTCVQQAHCCLPRLAQIQQSVMREKLLEPPCGLLVFFQRQSLLAKLTHPKQASKTRKKGEGITMEAEDNPFEWTIYLRRTRLNYSL